jgi:hypothetical protein
MGHRRRVDSSKSVTSAMPVYTIEAAIADALDQLHGRPPESAPPSDVAPWIWTGTRLVRASPQACECLHLLEILERAHLEHLHNLQRAYRQQRWQSYRLLADRLVSPLRSLLKRWVS